MSSSRISERPTSLIILLAKFRFCICVPAIKFLTACMPYSEMELSARLSSLKLNGEEDTGDSRECWWASWLCSHPNALSSGWGYAGISLSLLCSNSTWTSSPSRGQASHLYLGIEKKRFLNRSFDTCVELLLEDGSYDLRVDLLLCATTSSQRFIHDYNRINKYTAQIKLLWVEL